MKNPFRRRYVVTAYGMTATGEFAPPSFDNPTELGQTWTRRGAERLRDRYPTIVPMVGRPLYQVRVKRT